MDIFKIDAAALRSSEHRKSVNDLILNTVRANLMWLDSQMEDAATEIDALEKMPIPPDEETSRFFEAGWLYAKEVRENMLRILAAMAHIGDKEPRAYPFID